MLDTHLHAALQRLKSDSKPLLSIGEHHICKQWDSLSVSSRWLYSRLFHRKPKVFQRKQIEYVDENKKDWFQNHQQEQQAINELIEWYFLVDCTQYLSNEKYLRCLLRTQINKLCKVLLLDTSGNKADCIKRILASTKTFPRNIRLFLLQHRTFFENACLQYTHSHQLGLQQILLAETDDIPLRYVPYTTTQSSLIHRTRTDRREYRQYRALSYSQDKQSRLQTPLLYRRSAVEFRFSGLRFWIDTLLSSPPSPMTTPYVERLSAVLPFSKQLQTSIQIRLALSLYALDRGDEGRALLKAAFYDSSSLLHKILLSQTGRFISKRLKQSFPPMLVKGPDKVRTLSWKTTKVNSRQTYHNHTVEQAVLLHLQDNGRTAIRTENAPWNALFSLLLLDILFAQIDRTLPSPVLSAPVDFGTTELYVRRKTQIDTRLELIAKLGAKTVLDKQLEHFEFPIEQYRIRGCNWHSLTLDKLQEFCTEVPTTILLGILRHKLNFPQNSQRGLPDLVVLAGKTVRIPDAFPSKLPASFFFLEVKSEQDTISPYQRHWFHILHSIGAHVEVWNIRS